MSTRFSTTEKVHQQEENAIIALFDRRSVFHRKPLSFATKDRRRSLSFIAQVDVIAREVAVPFLRRG
jgi:hypothetical protein